LSEQVERGQFRERPSRPGRIRSSLLNVEVTPLSAPELIDRLGSETRSRTVIAAHNLHSVYLSHVDESFREFYNNADLILVDGSPILMAINLEAAVGRKPAIHPSRRIGSTDWLPHILSGTQVQKVCVLGASRESNRSFVERYSDSATFLGIPGDPWNSSEATQVYAKISAFDPDLTIVALGMPLQENVVSELVEAGVTGVLATVGGAVDQLSGAQKNAPRWMGRFGVEWLWRLASDPRRLAHRYLVEPFALAKLLMTREK